MGYFPCDYNCNTLPDHIRLQCNTLLKGGISVLGVLECDFPDYISDFSDLADLQAAIAAGRLKLIKGIKASYPLPSPIEIENPLPCGAENIVDGFTHKIDFTDTNISDSNDVFYKALNGRSTNLLLYECSTNKLRVVTFTVNWVAALEIPAKNSEVQKYTASATWISDNDNIPLAYTAPAGFNTL